MEHEIIKEAKKILKEADSGTNDCKIYNDGFIDGVNYAIQALRIHDVSGMCEHPWAFVIGDGEMKPAKCLKCGEYL